MNENKGAKRQIQHIDKLLKKFNDDKNKTKLDNNRTSIPNISELIPTGMKLKKKVLKKIDDLIKANSKLFQKLAAQGVGIPYDLIKNLDMFSPEEIINNLKASVKDNQLILKKGKFIRANCTKTEKPMPIPGPFNKDDEPAQENKNSPAPESPDNKEDPKVLPKQVDGLKVRNSTNGYVQEWNEDVGRGDIRDFTLKIGEDAPEIDPSTGNPKESFKKVIPSLKDSAMDLLNNIKKKSPYLKSLDNFLKDKHKNPYQDLKFDDFIAQKKANSSLGEFLQEKGINPNSGLTFANFLKSKGKNETLAQFFGKKGINLNQNLKLSNYLENTVSSINLFTYLRLQSRTLEEKFNTYFLKHNIPIYSTMTFETFSTILKSSVSISRLFFNFFQMNKVNIFKHFSFNQFMENYVYKVSNPYKNMTLAEFINKKTLSSYKDMSLKEFLKSEHKEAAKAANLKNFLKALGVVVRKNMSTQLTIEEILKRFFLTTIQINIIIREITTSKFVVTITTTREEIIKYLSTMSIKISLKSLTSEVKKFNEEKRRIEKFGNVVNTAKALTKKLESKFSKAIMDKAQKVAQILQKTNNHPAVSSAAMVLQAIKEFQKSENHSQSDSSIAKERSSEHAQEVANANKESELTNSLKQSKRSERLNKRSEKLNKHRRVESASQTDASIKSLSKSEEKAVLIKATLALLKAEQIVEKKVKDEHLGANEVNTNNLSAIAKSEAVQLANSNNRVDKSAEAETNSSASSAEVSTSSAESSASSADSSASASSAESASSESSAESNSQSTAVAEQTPFAGGMTASSSSQTESTSSAESSSNSSESSSQSSQSSQSNESNVSQIESEANQALGGKAGSREELQKANHEASSLLSEENKSRSSNSSAESDISSLTSDVKTESSKSENSESSAKSESSESSESAYKSDEISVNSQKKSSIISAGEKKIEQENNESSSSNSNSSSATSKVNNQSKSSSSASRNVNKNGKHIKNII